MIELTKLNDMVFTLNSDTIEMIEETPDTVITLVTGKKLVVKESRKKVVQLATDYKKKIHGIMD